MKQHSEMKSHFSLSLKTLSSLLVVLAAIVIIASAFKNEKSNDDNKDVVVINDNINTDSIESVQAFMKVYEVLMSPRCMNCHPSGDVPLNGDDNHLHAMLPKRGEDGKGVYAMKCANCHQATNTPGLHTPPGNPKWHLPPADMKMVFQGRTPTELAKQIMNPNMNGHKDKQQLLAHANDGLVIAAWNPGEGRTLPPMTHEEFVKVWTTWIEKGAYAP